MLKTIKTPEQHDIALARIYALMQQNVLPATPEGDELEVLAVLVEAYEKKTFPFPKPNPIEAIQFRMEQLGVTKEALMEVWA